MLAKTNTLQMNKGHVYTNSGGGGEGKDYTYLEHDTYLGQWIMQLCIIWHIL